MSSQINWSEPQQHEFILQCSVKEFCKEKKIIKRISIANKLYFVNSGVLGIYFNLNEIERKLWNIALPYTFTTAWPSFLMNLPNKLEIIALKDTVCVEIPITALQWLYENVAEGDKFGTLLYQNQIIIADSRFLIQKETSLQKKYENLLKIYPNINKHVNKKVISNLLDVSQEHFTREYKKWYHSSKK
ncbi:MAG: Crp/Fnr family transcriptional regulator [Bacteroidia bacterium]|nr:MAG: Crp/Fnr family transcriptional regulator [Bacteroidia bacterium]